MPDDFHVAARRANPVSLATIAREWGRIGVIGFGGPPAHIRLLRERCVERRGWMPGEDFEDALGACNLLPGPASTQLAVYCARVVAGTPGAIVGGLAFILPGLAAILALSAAVLSGGAPSWLRGAAAGAGAAVAVVALQAAIELGRASVRRPGRASATRWPLYALAGAAAAIFAGQAVVLALLGAGALELAARRRGHAAVLTPWLPVGTAGTPLARGSLLALGWVALKVGALSYGGGFVIIPLM
ncbi:MAG TPA: chromate transporter, partial [Solirubrobacteraceae bacterium]|nr:chromate transporter [Solirubrobacteraceae bacterium]